MKRGNEKVCFKTHTTQSHLIPEKGMEGQGRGKKAF